MHRSSFAQNFSFDVIRITLLIISIVFLSGCLYPAEQRGQNQLAAKEYMLIVQDAIDQFKKDTGVLPIKNSKIDTPIYEKYIIDFRKLQQLNYISSIPSNAFENGGTNYYVLVNAESKPEVKLMDIISIQTIGEIQTEIDNYMRDHSGQVPKAGQSVPHFYSIDFAKLGLHTVQVQSVYSRQFLGLLIDDSGKVVIDYAPEIMKAINKKGLANIDPKLDLRTYLVDESYFVPVKSLPYFWHDEQPTISWDSPPLR